MFYISAHYISRFIDEHMPEYKSQIMAGNIKYDGYNQNFIHNYHMMLRHWYTHIIILILAYLYYIITIITAHATR